MILVDEYDNRHSLAISNNLIGNNLYIEKARLNMRQIKLLRDHLTKVIEKNESKNNIGTSP